MRIVSHRSLAAWVACALALGIALPARAATEPVDVKDDMFVPARIEVLVGDTVRWSQTGTNDHSVVADDGSFDSHPACRSGAGQHTPATCLSEGETYERVFASAGEFPYHCKVHGRAGGIAMAGVVVVSAGSGGAAGGSDSSDGDGTAEEGGSAVKSDASRRGSLPGTGVPTAGWIGIALVGLAAGAGVVALRKR